MFRSPFLWICHFPPEPTQTTNKNSHKLEVRFIVMTQKQFVTIVHKLSSADMSYSPRRRPWELYHSTPSWLPVRLHLINLLDPSLAVMCLLLSCSEDFSAASEIFWSAPAVQALSSTTFSRRWCFQHGGEIDMIDLKNNKSPMDPREWKCLWHNIYKHNNKEICIGR